MKRNAKKKSQMAVDFLALESRVLMSGTHSMSEVPVLNSLPGAANTIFLDFNGDAAHHNTPAYDNDGNPTAFSDAELASISKIWQTVAEKFSPFNVNVVTGPTAPAGATLAIFGGTCAWTGISCTGYASGGVAYVFVGSQDAPTSYGTISSHELGHVFGLEHLTGYLPATWPTRNLIMHDTLGPRAIWYHGATDGAGNQDEISILASRLGYRADEADRAVGNTFSLTGVIGQTGDQDRMTFSTAGGAATFTVQSLSSTGGMLNPSLMLLNSAGQVVANSDGDGNLLAYQLGETISLNLAAGNYALVVYGHGDYGDVGQYTLTGTISGAIVAPTSTPTPTTVPLVTVPSSPTLLTATATSANQINLTWLDNGNDETGYKVERSSDSVNYTQIATLGANAVSFADTGRTPATTYYYRVKAYNSTGNSAISDAASAKTFAVAVPTAPGSLSVTATSTTQISLRWSDVADETGYKVERSSDGVNFTQITLLGANVVSYTDSGRAAGTQYVYRLRAFNAGGSSNFSNLVTTATLLPSRVVTPAISETLEDPTDFSVSYVGGHVVKLTWTDTSSAETGFEVWKSGDGAKWSLVKTLASNTSEWTTSNDNSYGKTYFWKVRSVNKYTRAVSNYTPVLSVSIPLDGKLSTWESLTAALAA